MGFDKTFPKSFRAQIWSFDVVFALVIFSIAVTVLAFTWFSINNQLSIGAGAGAVMLQLQAQTLQQQLLSTGAPASWQSLVNTTNTATWGNVSIGLAPSVGSSTISSSKLYTFIAMTGNSYQAAKLPLGAAYDYFVNIRSNAPGSYINVSIGRNPLAYNALSIYVLRSASYMNGIPVTLTTELWTNTTLATG